MTKLDKNYCGTINIETNGDVRVHSFEIENEDLDLSTEQVQEILETLVQKYELQIRPTTKTVSLNFGFDSIDGTNILDINLWNYYIDLIDEDCQVRFMTDEFMDSLTKY